ncbi:cupin domain-containing protein [Peribacillus alkalitolerans]|uniref:cupin domain-containing protein n=1 Tax=Peribacillus alkalitolerans TaxID=1550385 RepID=UPI0013D56F45|nr:cupin domain-containing protein [Peribacillus alkalitolerans]
MVSYMDYTSPSVQYTFDVNKNPLFIKDNNNFINLLGVKQLNTLENVSLLDIFLSTNNVVEPHYHQNAAELVYCISGSATVSMLNPFTKQILNYTITPGQVANVPQGWWHYEVALMDNTHLLAIFNAPTPEVILGSDILKFTPSKIMSHTYCIDEHQWKQAIEPVKPSTYIGPYKDCNREMENIPHQNINLQPQYIQQYPQTQYVQQYRQYWG